ncbi:MAG: universal stress protein [Rubrivivax sp.]
MTRPFDERRSTRRARSDDLASAGHRAHRASRRRRSAGAGAREPAAAQAAGGGAAAAARRRTRDDRARRRRARRCQRAPPRGAARGGRRRRRAAALHVRRGPELHAEIVDEARARGSGLVVIRRRGKRGLLGQLLVGEPACKVLAAPLCSVLVVPREAKLWQRSVLAAVHPNGDGAPVAAVPSLARESGAVLHAVCVAARERCSPRPSRAGASVASGRRRSTERRRIGTPAAGIAPAAPNCWLWAARRRRRAWGWAA